MVEPIVEHKPGNTERLIAFADAYDEDLFFMQELVADEQGRYIFFDCMPIESEYWHGSRVVHQVFYRPHEAVTAWNKQTGQRLSPLDLFKGLA